MSTVFKLQADAPAKLNLPAVGDRWIKRDQVCEVVDVGELTLVVEITSATENFSKVIALEDFDELRKATMENGAIFKPAKKAEQQLGPT